MVEDGHSALNAVGIGPGVLAKHCRRYIWHHLIDDPEVEAFDPAAITPPLRGSSGRTRAARDDRR